MDKEKQLKTLLRLFPYIHDKTRAEQLKIDEESGERIETNYSDGFKDGTEKI